MLFKIFQLASLLITIFFEDYSLFFMVWLVPGKLILTDNNGRIIINLLYARNSIGLAVQDKDQINPEV